MLYLKQLCFRGHKDTKLMSLFAILKLRWKVALSGALFHIYIANTPPFILSYLTNT